LRQTFDEHVSFNFHRYQLLDFYHTMLYVAQTMLSQVVCPSFYFLSHYSGFVNKNTLIFRKFFASIVAAIYRDFSELNHVKCKCKWRSFYSAKLIATIPHLA